MLAQHGRDVTDKLSQNEDIKILQRKIGKKCSRFQIVLGLTEQTVDTYKDPKKIHGPFTGDSDLDFFPWSKPRLKPSTISTPRSIPKVLSKKENSPSQKNSPSPGFDLATSEPNRTTIPSTKPETDAVPISTPTPGSPLRTLNKIHSFPIATVVLEKSFRLNFYSIAYTERFNSRLATTSGFSPSNLDSPGLYRANGRLSFVRIEQRRRASPYTPPRMPTLQASPRGSGPSVPIYRSPTSSFIRRPQQPKLIPTSQRIKSSPELPQLRLAYETERPRSARSLEAAFEKSKSPRTLLSGASGRVNPFS